MSVARAPTDDQLTTLRTLIRRWPGLRGLTVRQPWADLIMAGVKDVENRSWGVPSTLPQWGRCGGCGRRLWPSSWLERGADPNRFEFMWAGVQCHDCDGTFAADGPFPFRLGIHAAATVQALDAERTAWGALRDVWGMGAYVSAYHRARDRAGLLLGTVEVTGCHHADDGCRSCPAHGRACPWECDRHRPCSRWAEPDVWHWTLTDPQPLDTPIPMRGMLGLWRLDTEGGT